MFLEIIVPTLIIAQAEIAAPAPAEPQIIAGFNGPEDVYFPEGSDIGYVSNVVGSGLERDGVGFISRIDSEGNILDLEWTTGLHSPKGMRDDGTYLYVTDILDVVQISLATGEIVSHINAPGALLLNGLAIDAAGRLYAADTRQGAIYRQISSTEMEIWPLEDTNLTSVNGLIATDDELLALSSRTGTMIAINFETSDIELRAWQLGSPDGIENDGNGGHYISDMDDRMLHRSAEGVMTVVHASETPYGNNDFGINVAAGNLYVANYNRNTVTIIPLSSE